VPLTISGISPKKAASINVEGHSKSTFSDKIRAEKVSKNVPSLASSLKIEESADLNVISPNVGVEKMKTPKDMISRSSSLDKEKKDDINVNKTAVMVDKTETPKDMLAHARSLENPVNLNEISAYVNNVEAKPNMPVVYDSSLFGTPSETMVIPEEDFVWQ
jgi:hypothetical protein